LIKTEIVYTTKVVWIPSDTEADQLVAHLTDGKWGRNEVKALRAAMQLSVREFAQHLGVTDRAVSKWESATESDPGTNNQNLLSLCLRLASREAQIRFALTLDSSARIPGAQN